jgi:hypothetical protein
MNLPPASCADIPVVCTACGVVRILDSILLEEVDRTEVLTRLELEGVKARFRGRACPACSLRDYRPLCGPLFVPRR